MGKYGKMMFMENYLSYLEEKTLFTSPRVKKILKDTPVTTKKELFEQTQICDILVVYTPKKLLKNNWIKSKQQILSSFQGMPYSSSKIVIGKNLIMGYGADLKGSALELNGYNLYSYILAAQELCLVRVPGLTAAQKRSVVSYLKEREGLDYNSSHIGKQLWDRIVRSPRLSRFKNMPQDSILLRSLKQPLVCSSIIAVAFKQAGVDIEFAKSPYDVWPRDFILSPKTEKICRVDYK